MRVLLVAPNSPILNGGIAVWTAQYLSCCGEHNIESYVINTAVLGKRAESATAGRNYLDEFVRTKRIFKELNNTLKNASGFQAAHVNTSCSSFGIFRDYLIARKLCKKRIPVVTHYHCDIPNYVRGGLKQACLKRLASSSTKNLVLCESSRRYLEEQFSIAAVKVPNYVNEAVIRTIPKTISEAIQRMLFVGRIEETKGAAEMYALARRFPNISFELVGEVNQTVAQWGKPDNVLLLGGMPHDQVIKRLDEADVFLFPSHSEGFSVALLESMARGVPAIATDVGANADMLSDGCGIVVQKGDVDAMEQALRALEDPTKRREISCKAVEKVRTQYTTDAVMRALKEQYE